MDELSCLLALHMAPEMGAMRMGRLLDLDLPACEILRLADTRLAELGLPLATRAFLSDPDWTGVERGRVWLEQADHHLLRLGEPGYPALLGEIPDPPPLLFAVGEPKVLGLPQLAIVGARSATPGGLENAFEFARYLAQGGLAISSGLALGIDGAAHRGALAAEGFTVAVCATGLDRVYPAAHRDLAHRIAEQGLLLSEFPLGSPPLAGNFPRRNRIISGMSAGVLVVEAARRSGSLITARLASEQGREVFAIPGSIHNPLSRGGHQLIRQGAKLVETAEDIVEELGPLVASNRPDRSTPDRPDEPPLEAGPQRLLTLMGYDPVSTDTLVERSGLTAGDVSSMLLHLELSGHVRQHGGGLFIRSGTRS